MTWASELGLVGDGETDNAPILLAAFTAGTTAVIDFEPGHFMFGSQVELPSDTIIRGTPGGTTRFSPLPTFGPRGHLQTGMLSTVPNSRNVRVSDVVLDGMDVGMDGGSGDRICGLVTKRTLGFLVERVVSINWSGYSFWATGLDQVDGDRHCSGVYMDCRAANSNVLFEQNLCSGVWLIRCHGDDGRKTVPNCEAAFHPWFGAENVTFEDCSYVGAAGSGVTVLGVGQITMEGIVLRRCRIRMTGGSAAIQAGGQTVEDLPYRIGLTIEDSDISSPLGNCANIYNVDGAFRRSSFTGFNVCIGLGNAANVTFEDAKLLASNDPNGTAMAHSLYLDAGSAAVVTGGEIRARGKNPIAINKNNAATLTLSPQTVLEPALL